MITHPKCYLCEHFTGDLHNGICKAYPDGIPKNIWENEKEHNEPIEGYKFEPAKKFQVT